MTFAASPVRVLIAALGGEGGGVLASWLVTAAESCGYPAQTTSIPGVAQRTGSTTYYVEILPIARTMLGGREPVLALSPVPGAVDVLVASELVEASRAAQAGFVTPDCTTLIASLGRVYTVVEKSGMTDGRVDSASLERALREISTRAVLFDMATAARDAGTVVSAVMLGAIAGADVLAIPRDTFEQTIRASGRGAQASLRGFATGFEAAAGQIERHPSSAASRAAHGLQLPLDSGAGATERASSARMLASEGIEAVPHAIAQLEHPLRTIVEQGFLRARDYQDDHYARLYLDRVLRIVDSERAHAPSADYAVSSAYARFLALWMSYEDVIRVADLKTRRSRLARIRHQSGARRGDVLSVTEFLKPGVDEWSSILPKGLAARLRAWAQRRSAAQPLAIELRVETTSIHGFLMLRMLAALRWWRPRTSRYAEEQQLIERWTRSVLDALPRSASLAEEIAWCGRLIKGYGETRARGNASFERILETIVAASTFASHDARAQAVREGREAALADPGGRKLDQSLAQHGIPMRPVQPQPIVFHGHGSKSEGLRADAS